jgi:uncharacterized membrane protein
MTYSRTSAVRTGRDSDRLLALVVYGIYLVTLFSVFPSVVGVALAYFARGGARGTVYESHFDNQIAAFWGFAICVVVSGALWFLAFLVIPIPFAFLIGAIGWIYLAWKSIKGLIRALGDRPYR